MTTMLGGESRTRLLGEFGLHRLVAVFLVY